MLTEIVLTAITIVTSTKYNKSSNIKSAISVSDAVIDSIESPDIDKITSSLVSKCNS